MHGSSIPTAKQTVAHMSRWPQHWGSSRHPASAIWLCMHAQPSTEHFAAHCTAASTVGRALVSACQLSTEQRVVAATATCCSNLGASCRIHRHLLYRRQPHQCSEGGPGPRPGGTPWRSTGRGAGLHSAIRSCTTAQYYICTHHSFILWRVWKEVWVGSVCNHECWWRCQRKQARQAGNAAGPRLFPRTTCAALMLANTHHQDTRPRAEALRPFAGKYQQRARRAVRCSNSACVSQRSCGVPPTSAAALAGEGSSRGLRRTLKLRSAVANAQCLERERCGECPLCQPSGCALCGKQPASPTSSAPHPRHPDTGLRRVFDPSPRVKGAGRPCRCQRERRPPARLTRRLSRPQDPRKASPA